MSIYVVTGANRGIGLEMCRQLKVRGDEVVAVCRQSSSELSKLGVRVIDGIDVRQSGDCDKLRDTLADAHIDALVQVAGVLRKQSLGGIDAQAVDEIRLQFDTNAIAPVLVVQALVDRMGKGSKIGIITSRMGSIADNDSGGSYGYRMSKAAVNAAGKSLAVDLKDSGIAVALLHPGYVRTDMTGHSGFIDPDESVKGLLARLDELTINTTGCFWHQNGECLPW